jgi:hypothetical protein
MFIDSLSLIAAQIDQIAGKIDKIQQWQESHENQSSELLKIKDELQYLVSCRRWLRSTYMLVAWVGGAVIAITLFWHTIVQEWTTWHRGP